MSKNSRYSLFFFIIILAAATLSGHDLWLVPHKFKIEPGDLTQILANTGMDFPNSLSAVTPDRVDQFIIVGKSVKEYISALEVQDNSLVAEYTFEKPGTYIAAAALKPKEIKLTAKEFNEYLLHDGMPNIYELRKKEGILDQDAVEYYSKYPKTIIQVGTEMDDSPTKPLGLPIEIILRVNPYKLKSGDNLGVTILFQGEPLPDAEVAWSYPGRGEEFAGSIKTDANGQASIPLVKAGPYVIRLTHMEWIKQETHEWESYWTSLTFEVTPD